MEWWEVEDNERNEQDDVEVVEVAWRLHRERRVLRDLTQLYAICKFGVAEVTARQQIKKQVYLCAGDWGVARHGARHPKHPLPEGRWLVTDRRWFVSD